MIKSTVRITPCLFLLLILAVSAPAWGALSKGNVKKSPGRIPIDKAPIAKLAGIARTSSALPPLEGQEPQTLGIDEMSASQSPGMQIGITTYDEQHVGRMNRQVDWRGTQDVHFTWTVQSSYDLYGDCGTSYEAWESVFAELVWEGPDGGCDVHPRLGAGNNYSGYVGLDVAPDGRVVIANHHDEGAGFASTFWPDFQPLSCFFSPFKHRLPDSLQQYDAADTSEFVFPSMEVHIYNGDTVVHMLAKELVDPGTTSSRIYYFRHVGEAWIVYPGPNPTGTWDYPPKIIDTANVFGHTVAASRVSGKVALVWLANPPEWPGGTESADRGLQHLNNIYYMESNDMGASWGPKSNITQWDSSQVDWAAETDISALITSDDNLHVIWNARETNPDVVGLGVFPHYYGSRLLHWAEGQSIRVIRDANWDLPYDQTWCHGGDWNEMSMVKMQLSECDGKLYALFVQFNDMKNGNYVDCHNRAYANHEHAGTANGELYISISDNGGMNWDIARNLTNSYTDQCDSAMGLGGTLECDADMWPSMSRFGMEVTTGDFTGVPVVDPSGEYTGNYYLDVLYINDKHPGAAIYNAGVWTTNPVKWFRVPCVGPIPNPVIVYTPMHIGDPTWTKPCTQRDTTIRIYNIGNAWLNISSINVVYLTGGHSGWLGYSPEITYISESDPNYVDFTIYMNQGGWICDNGVGVSGAIIFHSDAPSSPDTIFVDLIVADSLQWPEYATIHTECKALYISNAGQLGKSEYVPQSDEHAWGNLQYYEDCDTTDNATGGDDDISRYLYESSPFILRLDGNDTVLSTTMFTADWLKNDGFRPLEGLTVDSSGGWQDCMYASTGKMVTQDSMIALTCEYYAPFSSPYYTNECEFVIQRLRVYSNTEQGFEGLFIGQLSDWDIPSDSGVENGSDWDAGRQMMYCYGGEYGPDSIANNDCILADQRLGGLVYYAGYRRPHCTQNAYNVDSFPDVRGMWTATNADWVFPQERFVAGQLYQKMALFGGYETWESTNPWMEDSLYQDLHMVSVYGQFNLDATDTLVFYNIFSTSKTGLGDLQNSIDDARAWISDQGLFGWPPLEECSSGNCCLDWGLPGDANKDNDVNLFDIIAILDYLFNNDPDPTGGCPGIMDVDGSGYCIDYPDVNIRDVGYLMRYVYCGGDPPVCPATCSPQEIMKGKEVQK